MDGQCNFFVSRKKRLCRITARPGALYCAEHSPRTEPQDVSTSRIVCPLDPKHTCFANKLDKHLKICNAREKDSPSFIVKGCNYQNDVVDAIQSEKRYLGDVPESLLAETIATVTKIYDETISGNILNKISTEPHICVKHEIENATRAENSKRHFVQISSLLKILEQENLLSENTCFIELGAGRGHVSYYLAETTLCMLHTSVVLIDKASHRHKQDNKIDKESKNVERIRADIADLVLSEVPLVKRSENLVGVSKHLCGMATDLALRCLVNPTVLTKTRGIIMATCCHHRCFWNTYVGKPFLQEKGITQPIFNIICGLVSWATCGSGLSRERRSELYHNSHEIEPKKAKYEDKAIKKESDDQASPQKYPICNKQVSQSRDPIEGEVVSDVKNKDVNLNNKKHLGLSLAERSDIGYKAKAILDWGRVMYLRNLNFDTKLCYYVETNTSPENVCIIATKM